MIGWMVGWMNWSCCTVLQIKKIKKQSSKNYLQKNFDWIKKLLKDYETIGFSIKTLFVNLLIYYLLKMQQMHFKLISFIQAKKCRLLYQLFISTTSTNNCSTNFTFIFIVFVLGITVFFWCKANKSNLIACLFFIKNGNMKKREGKLQNYEHPLLRMIFWCKNYFLRKKEANKW